MVHLKLEEAREKWTRRLSRRSRRDAVDLAGCTVSGGRLHMCVAGSSLNFVEVKQTLRLLGRELELADMSVGAMMLMIHFKLPEAARCERRRFK